MEKVVLTHWFNHELLNLVKFRNFENCSITVTIVSTEVKHTVLMRLKPLVITSEPTLGKLPENLKGHEPIFINRRKKLN